MNAQRIFDLLMFIILNLTLTGLYLVMLSIHTARQLARVPVRVMARSKNTKPEIYR
jgi:hypothetical protein